MNLYQVSARKYRPNDFEDVVGQNHVTESLQNSINLSTISHAYIFCGPRGVGKTSCARIFAKKLNKTINSSTNDYSYNIFELDAASNNSVDDIRDLVNQVKIPPQTGNYKIYIIDEAHMLSKSAFNAFLKTLEEPPKHCVFILATTEKEKIIPTILSRCQIFDFKRITEQDISNYLSNLSTKENINADKECFDLIAKKADGALRDALSIFDKVNSFCGTKWTIEKVSETLHSLDESKIEIFINLIKNNKIGQILVEFDTVLKNGFEGDNLISGLIDYFRNIMISKDPVSLKILQCSKKTEETIVSLAEFYTTNQLIQILDILSTCQKDYTKTNDKRFLVELCLMQISSIENINSIKKKIQISKPDKEILNNPSIENGESVNEKEIKKKEQEDSNNLDFENLNNNILEKKVPQENKNNFNTDLKKSLLGTSTIDEILNKEISEEKKIKNGIQDKKSRNVFNEEEMLNKIDLFCEILKNEKKINLHSTIKANKPELSNDFSIFFKLNSKSQKKEILENKVALLSFLKKELNNDLIDIKIELNEKEAKELLYTEQEKLNYMINKKPELKKIIKSLDLDFLN